MLPMKQPLVAEQRLASVTPFVKVEFKSKDLNTTLEYNTKGDGASDESGARILSIVHHENAFAHSGTNYAAVIRLNNYDRHFLTKSLEGYTVRITYGYEIGGESEADSSLTRAPMWVTSQRSVTERGVLVEEFFCMDVWQRMTLMLTPSGSTKLVVKDTITNTFVHGEEVEGAGGAKGLYWSSGEDIVLGKFYIIVKTVVDGSFQNNEVVSGTGSPPASFTTDASGAVITNSVGEAPVWERDTTTHAIINEMVTTMELPAALVAASAVNIDVAEPTDSVGNLQNNSPYVRTDVESSYYAIVKTLLGFTRSALILRDNSHAAGKFRLFYTPSNPQTMLVGAITNNFVPGETISQNQGGSTAQARVVYQNNDDDYLVIEAQNSTAFNTTHSVTGAAASMTPSSIKAYGYEYHANHPFYSFAYDRHLVTPNRIIFVDRETFPTPKFSGTAASSASEAAIGTLASVHVGGYEEIASDDDASKRATALMHQLEREKSTGNVLVRMNVAQEVWDMVRVDDTDTGMDRSGLDITDRISGLTFYYRSAQVGSLVYGMQLRFGALSSRYTTSKEQPLTATTNRLTDWYKDFNTQLLAALDQLTSLQEQLDKRTTPTPTPTPTPKPTLQDERTYADPAYAEGIPAQGPTRDEWGRDFSTDPHIIYGPYDANSIPTAWTDPLEPPAPIPTAWTDPLEPPTQIPTAWTDPLEPPTIINGLYEPDEPDEPDYQWPL